MEDNTTTVKSIWGTWWTSFRKWFYASWLIYETGIRFYEYALPVHQYFMRQGEHLGENTAQVLAYLCSSLTFMLCFFFLTVPATIALFRYFKMEDTSRNTIEQKIKTYF